MKKARIVNALLWLYLWLSDALSPAITPGDFWAEKGRQLFRLNSHLNDPPRLIGNAIIPIVLWLAIDWALRRVQKRRTTARKSLDVEAR